MQVRIDLARQDDIALWMTLAAEVAPLFGPMPDLDVVLERKISQNQAYCARLGTDRASQLGGTFIGGAGTEHWIRWLAVFSEYRGLGVGRLLVETAISSIPKASSIYVDTFPGEAPGADAANRLYLSCGFAPTEVWRAGEMVRQRYMRRPS